MHLPMKLNKLAYLLSCLSVAFLATTASSKNFGPSSLKPPVPQREFRAGWIATVGNIDWPSKPGLPVEEQKSELIALMNRAAKLKLNAIVLQVRPACDALYA